MRRKRSRAKAQKAALTAAPPAPAPDDALPDLRTSAAFDRVTALTEAVGGELGRLRSEMRGRDADLAHALERIADSYDRVAARLDDDRRVQALLAEALIRIDRRLASIEQGRGVRNGLSTGPRVIGGSITPPTQPPRLEG